MADRPDTMPFDASELKPCSCCGKGVSHNGSPVFYELTMRLCVIDARSVQQIAGLEMTMGSPALARVFAPSTVVAHRLPASRHLVCADCAMRTDLPPMYWLDSENDEDDA